MENIVFDVSRTRSARKFNAIAGAVLMAGTMDAFKFTHGKDGSTGLFEQANTLRKEALDVITKAKAEGRDLTEDETNANNDRFAKITAANNLLEQEKRFAGEAFKEAVTQAHQPGAQPVTTGDAILAETQKKERDAFNKFLLSGDKDTKFIKSIKNEVIVPQAMNNKYVIATVGGAAAGTILPTQVGRPMTIRRLYNSILAAIAVYGLMPIYTAGTESFNIPVFDDTANSGQSLAENASGATDLDPALSDLALGSVLYDSKTIWLSNTQLLAMADAGVDGFDLVSYILPILAKRIELLQDNLWITKIITNATAIANTFTTASPTAITYAELVGWFHSLPAVYRADGVFIVSDGLLKLLESLVDNQNRPLLSDAIVDGSVKTLKGKPVFISGNLATPASTVVTGIFASAEALVPRIVTNTRIARYANIPTYPDQSGFRQFVNGDFNFVNAGVRTLTMHA